MTIKEFTPFRSGTFAARIIPPGGNYGLSAINKYDKPLIQFYDTDYIRPDSGWPFGQPVSQYFLDTFMAIPEDTGLFLDCGVDKWQLTADQVSAFQAYAQVWIISNGES